MHAFPKFFQIAVWKSCIIHPHTYSTTTHLSPARSLAASVDRYARRGRSTVERCLLDCPKLADPPARCAGSAARLASAVLLDPFSDSFSDRWSPLDLDLLR